MLHLFLKGICLTSRSNRSFMPRLSRLELESLQHVPWFVQQRRCLLFVWKGNCSPAAFMPLQHFPSAPHTNNCLTALHKSTVDTDSQQKNTCVRISSAWIFSLNEVRLRLAQGGKRVKVILAPRAGPFFLEKERFLFHAGLDLSM